MKNLLSMAVIALCAAAPARAQAPVDPPARIVALIRNIDVAADGSWTMTSRAETKILQQSAIAALAQTPLNYSDTLQQMDVTEAHTLKADGTTLAVAPDAIITQQSPAAKGSPLLSDMKQKVILYPNVEVGDTLVYDVAVRSKPMLANNFVYNLLLPKTLLIDNATVTISLPKSMGATTDFHGFELHKTSQGDRVIYTVHYANQNPVSAGAQAVSVFDRAPRFTLSTFKDYDAFANTYAALALPAMAVTPAIQQQADRITQGVDDRYQQARLIYEWVASHIRYVAVEFGQGSIVPHSAGAVLTNAYGDCKDHAVLFSALLKAKGIDSNMAIINATDSYSVPETPSIVPFDHVITWLPEFKIYADTTNGRDVPFGLLPRSEYGKETIHVADRRALYQVPMPDGKTSTDSYKLTVHMDDEGRIDSESSSTGTGDFATPMRQLGVLLQGDNGKKLALALLQKSRTPLATGAFMVEPPDVERSQYKISATYAPPGPMEPLAAGTKFELGDNLKLLNPLGDIFYGPVMNPKFKAADLVPCYSGHSIDDETLEFPSTRHLDRLPDDANVRTQHITYSSHWSQTPGSVNVHREFEARFEEPLCNAMIRDEVQAALVRIRADAAAASFAVPRN